MNPRIDQSPNPLRFAREFIAPGVGRRRVFTLLVPESCRYGCDFCPMSASRRLPEVLRTSQGLARLFLTAFRRGLCDGLFVTAGVPRHPARAMAKILEIVELLRVQYGFRGYIHVKSVPGAHPGQVQKVVNLADRVSSHLEPACRNAVLTKPAGAVPKELELYATPEAASRELREALAASARRAPGPLPPAGLAGRKEGQLSLFGARRPSPAEDYASG